MEGPMSRSQAENKAEKKGEERVKEAKNVIPKGTVLNFKNYFSRRRMKPEKKYLANAAEAKAVTKAQNDIKKWEKELDQLEDEYEENEEYLKIYNRQNSNLFFYLPIGSQIYK